MNQNYEITKKKTQINHLRHFNLFRKLFRLFFYVLFLFLCWFTLVDEIFGCQRNHLWNKIMTNQSKLGSAWMSCSSGWCLARDSSGDSQTRLTCCARALNSALASRLIVGCWVSYANKATVMDCCQVLTFFSYISRLSNAKVPFTQSFTVARSTSTHHIEN